MANLSASKDRKSSVETDTRRSIDGLKRSDFYLPTAGANVPGSGQTSPAVSPLVTSGSGSVPMGATQVSAATIETINVFRGTHAFVIMTDPFKVRLDAMLSERLQSDCW